MQTQPIGVSNAAAVALIAERLPNGLVHPGDGDTQPAKPIPMPWLGNLGLPAGQSEQFAREAGMPANDAPKVLAEAIVHLLESDGGFDIVPRTEIAQLRGEAATLDDLNPSAPVVAIHCRCNAQEPVLSLSVGRAKVTLDGAALRTRLDEVCGCS
jgi:hypothetical protein